MSDDYTAERSWREWICFRAPAWSGCQIVCSRRAWPPFWQAFGRRCLLALASFALVACGRSLESRSAMSQASAPLAVLLPGILSEPGVSRAYSTFSPDGKSLYVAHYEEFGSDRPVILQISRRENGRWSAPRTVPFADTSFDHQPCVSADGRFLYFVSRRPVNGVPRGDSEIWRAAIRGDAWGAPEHLAVLGGPGNEYAPFLARSGRIYFSSDREGGYGSGDLYVAEPVGGGFESPKNLGSSINGPSGEWGSTVDKDEQQLVFESSDRAANLSDSGDLYLSNRVDGAWAPPRHLAPPVSSPASDLAPRISRDGRFLDFASNRNGAVQTLRVPLRSIRFDGPPR